MKNTQKRRNAVNALQHTYKITKDGGVLFYRVADHLVYYTLQSVLSRKHRLPVLGTSHMYTHVHEATRPEDTVQLSAYEHDLSFMFARDYNRETGRSGPLFLRHYGSAPKRQDKDMRSCMIYVFNNPVEKRLVSRAIEDRWNFLAYYGSDYPFSQKPVLRYCRKCLVDAIHLVEHEYKSGRYLKYQLLNNLFAPLNNKERIQLIDFIIQRYFFFDLKACEDLFGSLDKMIHTTDYSTGKEFDVGEVFDPSSDVPYREMCSVANKEGLLGPGMPLFHMSDSRRMYVKGLLKNTTDASEQQIAKFLHIK